MTAPRGGAAEVAQLRPQVAALAEEAERIAAALNTAGSFAAIMKTAWDDGFAKGQASVRPAESTRAKRDRLGFRLVDSTSGGAS